MSEDPHLALPPLVILGDARLARPSAPLDPAQIRTDAFQERLQTLQEAMFHYLGIGIAAPQIGWFERFFIMTATLPNAHGEPAPVMQAWINPEIVSASPEQCWAWEGCLSVPGLRGWIRRPRSVAVRGYNERGEAIGLEYTDWNARVFQHEFDHLDGMLFPYRAVDPRHVVATEALEEREDWPDGWPAPQARDTPLGEVWPEPPDA